MSDSTPTHLHSSLSSSIDDTIGQASITSSATVIAESPATGDVVQIVLRLGEAAEEPSLYVPSLATDNIQPVHIHATQTCPDQITLLAVESDLLTDTSESDVEPEDEFIPRGNNKKDRPTATPQKAHSIVPSKDNADKITGSPEKVTSSTREHTVKATTAAPASTRSKLPAQTRK
ncbi:hypothetical protein BD413DRAFT_102587 [Trametes elegans]|nr:hypothetical protein BD413DRAFT_102587 [Trametes elegans]